MSDAASMAPNESACLWWNMIKRYNNLSFVFGVPGLIVQIVGNVLRAQQPNSLLPILVVLGGTGLLLVGFAYYALAKGRNPAWCLVAFLSCIGLIILALLKDKSGTA
jgi:O-antigen/teichoic acid export membrane protein